MYVWMDGSMYWQFNIHIVTIYHNIWAMKAWCIKYDTQRKKHKHIFKVV